MQVSVFSRGGTRYKLKSNKKRSLWRETSFMLHLVSQAVNPRFGLGKCIQDWGLISSMLSDNSRKREMQMEILGKTLRK